MVVLASISSHRIGGGCHGELLVLCPSHYVGRLESHRQLRGNAKPGWPIRPAGGGRCGARGAGRGHGRRLGCLGGRGGHCIDGWCIEDWCIEGGEGHVLYRPEHRRPGADHVWSRRGAVVHQPGNNSIGRITTAGVVTNYTDPSISDPGPHRGRAGRGAVVHQLRQQLDRADHHRRGGDQLHRHRRIRTGRYHGGTRRGVVVHQHRQRLDRADHDRRSGDTNYTGTGIANPDGIVAGPDGALWFTNDSDPGSIGRITTDRGGDLLRGGVVLPQGDRRRPRPERCGSPPLTARSGRSPPTGS